MNGRIVAMSRRAKWILNGTEFVVAPNFFLWWLAVVWLGGDAFNGYIRDSHYFICAHGACREVSSSIWTYSYWHTISGFAGLLLIFIEAAVLVTTRDMILDFGKNV